MVNATSRPDASNITSMQASFTRVLGEEIYMVLWGWGRGNSEAQKDSKVTLYNGPGHLHAGLEHSTLPQCILKFTLDCDVNEK